MGARTQAWDDAETAFLLIYAEECLRKEIDFKDTIKDELFKICGRERAQSSIYRKLARLAQDFAIVNNRTAKRLTDGGIEVLDRSKLMGKPDLLDEMEKLRKSRKLAPLWTTTKSSPVKSKAPQANNSNKTSASKDSMPSKQSVAVVIFPKLKRRSNNVPSYAESEDNGVDAVEQEDPDYSDSDVTKPVQKKRKLAHEPELISNRKRYAQSDSTLLPQVDTTPERGNITQDPVASSPGNSINLVGEDAAVMEKASPSPSTSRSGNAQLSEDSATVVGDTPMIEIQDSQEDAADNEGLGARPIWSPISPTTASLQIKLDKAARKEPGEQMLHDSLTADRAQHNPSELPQHDVHMSETIIAPPTAEEHLALVAEVEEMRKMIEDHKTILSYITNMKTTDEPIHDEHWGRLKSIWRSAEYSPGLAKEDLFKAHHSAINFIQDLQEKQRSQFANDGVDDSIAESTAPEAEDVNLVWQKIQQYIHDAAGYDNNATLPTLITAGFLAARLQDIAKDGRSNFPELSNLVTEMKQHLDSLHSIRALMGAFFIRSLFASPEPMCEDIYSEMQLDSYKRTFLGDKYLAQDRDKADLKGFVADQSFQSQIIPERAATLLNDMKHTFQDIQPTLRGFESIDKSQTAAWFKGAIKLKLDLMLSPDDYRIHFAMPCTTFDPTWMQAQNNSGVPVSDEEAKEKLVLACLFPALGQQDPTDLELGTPFEDILARNKTFFPTFEERNAFDPKTIIAKATVLIDETRLGSDPERLHTQAA